MELSGNQIKQFWDDGYLIVHDLLSLDEARVLLEHAESIASGQEARPSSATLQVEPRVAQAEAHADNYADSLRKMSHLAFSDKLFENHARHPRILDVIESLLGPDLKLYQDQLFMKPPKVGSRQPYHQDMPLGFYIDPADMVTCWAALTDSTIENGCLWVIPATHRQGILEKAVWQQFEAKALAGQLLEEQPIELRPGSCSFHHGLLLHSSRPNLSGKRRRGYATHYVSARCRYTSDTAKNDAMLVRGRAYQGCV